MGFGTKSRILHILLTGKQLPTGGWYQNWVFARRCPHPLGYTPEYLMEMDLLLQWLLLRCLPKKVRFGTFYSLVSSSPQTDGIRILSLLQGGPIPMAAPLTIWWRWAHSFRGSYRGLCWKTAFGTFCSLMSSSPQADSIWMGSLPQGIPTHWAAPLTIWWGWAHTFRGYSRGVCWKKQDFLQKMAFGTFDSLVSSSTQADSVRMGSLTQGISTPWAAPLTLWWRWVHSFRGYSRSVYSKNRI